jgi:hypothetical protein
MLAVVVLNITTQNAMAQMETCPSGYYLATNNLCYPYQQQQQQQMQGTVNQSSKLSDSFKTLRDSLIQYLGRALGVEFAYNSTGVGIHVTCMKLGGPLFNYLISKVPANVSSLTIATKLEQKGLICHN